jgi:Icc-related predicted phosphoesterase
VRIAYLVDVHDRFDAVPQAMEEIGPVDVLIVGGDITTGGLGRAKAWKPHRLRV